MPVTHLIGGPRARDRVIFRGDELEVAQIVLHQKEPGGPTYSITRAGRYRKFSLVPTQAIWTGWKVIERSMRC